MSFGANLKKIRQDNNLTQEELAEKINTSRSNIANYENDKNMPSVDILIKLAGVFHSSVDYLIGIKTTENKKEELEKRLYHFNLTEEEYNSAISCFMNGAKKYEALEIAIQYVPISNDDEMEKERQVLLEISEFVSSFIPDNFINNSNNKISMIKDFKERDLAYENFYAELDRYLEKAKEFLLSLDKSKIIHNYKKSDINMFPIPVIGKIVAGQPILVEEYLEGYLPVAPNIYGITVPDDYFYLKVSGESMNLKIHNGDYALIKKQDYAENGDIIVAIVNGDDEATIKRYKKLNDELVMLEPMSTYPIEPLVINLKNTKFQIIGKAIAQFGKF